MRIEKLGFLFVLFCAWIFVLIGRPQDIFTSLNPIRPALSIGLLVAAIYIFNYTRIASQVTYNSQVRLFVLLFCLMIVSIPFAYHRRFAFMFIFTQYITVALFFFIFYSIIDSIERIRMTLLVGCLGATLYTMFALAQGKTVDNRLMFGDMFDPNDLVYFVISFFTFNFLFLTKDSRLLTRLLCTANLMIGIVLILKTGSRGGFIALCVVGGMLLIRKSRILTLKFKVVFVAIAVVGLFNIITHINFMHISTLEDIGNDYNVTDEEGRLAVWKIGFRLMLSHPLGVGVNCFPEAIGEDRVERGVLPKWQAAHNSLIQIGAETGPIGFVLFLMINLKALKMFRQVKREARSDALRKIGDMAEIGFVGNFICSMFLSQAYSIYWVFYIVLSAVLDRLKHEDFA